ncbi:type II toxin-antitoxin system RelE/ParE family toxin [Luminiphilus syltensis]|nr:type II toxin-antitoxin system RelE/ParE family toxin [Luminiphilus syltensis]
MRKIVRPLPEFTKWLNSLDGQARGRISARLTKVSRGLTGDVKPVGDGVFELREHFGPGYRMYFLEREKVMVIMLGRGTKRTQTGDIEKAKSLARDLEE